MIAGRQAAALLPLVALLGWTAPAVAAGASTPQSRPPNLSRPPASSLCLARCAELEVLCKAFENRYPSCSPNDICLEEKRQCEALCHPRVKLSRRARP
jgi:hypothetical protein